jgi:hypothetical protein
VKVREPVARPLDVVAAELSLSASQAFLVGVLFYLAVGVWDDRGVGFGPVVVVVAALGLAVGGGWLYWLMGGVGWPLAAANVPTALFLGFALVLGWSGDDLFRVEGIPLLLSVVASVFGLVCGVFLDSPRRLRWDQRPRPRPGTKVPRVSATTQRLAAQVPRSIPRRSELPPAGYPVARPGQGAVPERTAEGEPLAADAADAGDADPVGEAPVGSVAVVAAAQDDGEEPGAAGMYPTAGTTAALVEDATPTPLGAMMPTERLEKMASPEGGSAPPAPSGPTAPADPGAIELPTSIEPRAQRSPWAWAAPPEWTRDEDDEPPRRRSSRRS